MRGEAQMTVPELARVLGTRAAHSHDDRLPHPRGRAVVANLRREQVGAAAVHDGRSGRGDSETQNANERKRARGHDAIPPLLG